MSGQPQGLKADLAALLPRLWRYARVLSFDAEEADDLVQMTCVRALERTEQFVPGTRLDSWLFTILRSIWLNQLRSRRVRTGQGSVDAASLYFDGAAEIEANILAHQVLKEVQALPDAQREAVFLVYVEGFSYREAAEFLAIPIGTIMSRLAAARLRLGPLNEETLVSAKAAEQKR
jgi:RNA polymerase sigma-70 factor, ECF subfamily